MSIAYKARDMRLVSEAEESEPAVSESVIDRYSHFNGLYRTSHDLRVEGSAEGEIECDGTLTVAPDANIDAKVRAHNVVIAGAATGEIMCENRFTLRPTGQMRGQVLAASLVVEEGAFFEGEFQMSTDPATWESRRAEANNVSAAPGYAAQPHANESYATPGYYDTVSDNAAETDDVVSSGWDGGVTEDDEALTQE